MQDRPICPDALPGDVAFVSQSGALVTAVLDGAKSRRIGFSHMVSRGESVDVDFGDLLDYLSSDAGTRSILLYIESIQAPHRFMSARRRRRAQPMVQRPSAQELILGASVDPMFGPVLLFGQGGTAVELLADRAIGLPPLNRTLARDLIGRTRVAKLLAGYRDHPPARLDAICDALIALSQMLADLPELAELDINPLWVDPEGVIALDARVRVSLALGAGTERFAIHVPGAARGDRVVAGPGLLLRPIRPEDEALHRAFVEDLAPEDLRMHLFSSPASCRAANWHGWCRSTMRARWLSLPWPRGQTVPPKHSAWCGRWPTPTTSRPSSPSSCDRT